MQIYEQFKYIKKQFSKETMKALELAKLILTMFSDKDITPMKLQKLAFYAKAWTLVSKQPFIHASFEKWDYGPVNQDIYHAYKQYGASIIPTIKGENSCKSKHVDLLQFILSNYIDYSAFTLSAMTHNEAPWQETAVNNIIKDKLIVSYYSQQPFAKNFTQQNETNKPFHVLKSNVWHSFTLDMDPGEAAAFETAPSYDDFSKKSKQASHEFEQMINDISDLIN